MAMIANQFLKSSKLLLISKEVPSFNSMAYARKHFMKGYQRKGIKYLAYVLVVARLQCPCLYLPQIINGESRSLSS